MLEAWCPVQGGGDIDHERGAWWGVVLRSASPNKPTPGGVVYNLSCYGESMAPPCSLPSATHSPSCGVAQTELLHLGFVAFQTVSQTNLFTL